MKPNRNSNNGNSYMTSYRNNPDLFLSAFDDISQGMLGFSSDFGKTILDTALSTTGNYPPYNMISVSPNEYRVEVACAGFANEDLDVVVEKDVLTISGSKKRATPEQSDGDVDNTMRYHHKGISQRAFERKFVLAKNAKVSSAQYVNGILSVSVVMEVPPEDEPKKIAIM